MKNIFTILLALSALIITAQDSLKSNLSLEGSADIYYRRNISTSNTEITPATSFANGNGFSLGMFNLIGFYDTKNTGFVADLVFGPRGEDAVFLSSGSSNIINQLYAYWDVSDNLTLTMGNFNTFLGYEVISPSGNFNYSTSYMFSYGPFSHSGLKADFNLSENLTGMLAVLNATDATDFNPTNFNTLGVQLGYKGTYLNALYGKQDASLEPTFQLDLTAGYDLSKKFYLGVNSTYNKTDKDGFYGLALYPQYDLGKLTAGLRSEYFAEINSGIGAIAPGANVINFTTTLDYSVENLNLKLEYRLDKASEQVFEQKDNLSSIVLAAVYSFN
jgi:hypothetical protein|tara:strand:- start:992 stop:1984 length:993 start_codon:yes stop_codon:yes gene_type:complete